MKVRKATVISCCWTSRVELVAWFLYWKRNVRTSRLHIMKMVCLLSCVPSVFVCFLFCYIYSSGLTAVSVLTVILCICFDEIE